MINHLLRKLRKTLRRKLGKKLHRIKSRLTEWVRWVTGRASREPDFIETAAASVAVLVQLFCRSCEVRRIVRRAALALAVLLRTLREGEQPPDLVFP